MTDYLYEPNLHYFSYYLLNKSSWNQENQAEFQPETIIESNQSIPLTGFYSYFRVHDTYNLNLNIRVPEKDDTQGKTIEKVPLNIFSTLNLKLKEKKDSLPAPPQSSDFLGETIILTGILETPPNTTEETIRIAKECLKNFNANASNFPYQAGELFGSPIFEFFDKSNPKTSPQIIVWLYLKKEPTDDLDKAYYDFSDLFLYFHKNIYAYEKTRILETFSNLAYQEISTIIPSDTSTFKEQNHLDDYNTKLTEIYQINKEYIQYYTELETSQNTININTKNYEQILNQLQNKLTNEKFKFFQIFLERSQQYQQQITADINYFAIRLRLIEQQINTLRAQIEIQQAKINRYLENTLQEQANSLQALGTGLATGAIFASCLPYLIKQEAKEIKPPLTTPHIHPFLATLGISLIAGLGAWFLVSLRLEGRKFLQRQTRFLVKFLPKNRQQKKLSPTDEKNRP